MTSSKKQYDIDDDLFAELKNILTRFGAIDPSHKQSGVRPYSVAFDLASVAGSQLNWLVKQYVPKGLTKKSTSEYEKRRQLQIMLLQNCIERSEDKSFAAAIIDQAETAPQSPAGTLVGYLCRAWHPRHHRALVWLTGGNLFRASLEAGALSERNPNHATESKAPRRTATQTCQSKVSKHNRLNISKTQRFLEAVACLQQCLIVSHSQGIARPPQHFYQDDLAAQLPRNVDYGAGLSLLNRCMTQLHGCDPRNLSLKEQSLRRTLLQEFWLSSVLLGGAIQGELREGLFQEAPGLGEMAGERKRVAKKAPTSRPMTCWRGHGQQGRESRACSVREQIPPVEKCVSR